MRTNYNILIVLIFYYLILGYIPYIEILIGFNIPKLICGLLFVAFFSIVFGLRSILLLLLTAAIFVTSFFSFTTFNSLHPNALFDTLYLDVFAIKFYYLFLAPFAFVGAALNYYDLVKQASKMGSNLLAKILIPVLIKKELIVSRYAEILFSLRARGFETTSRFEQIKLLRVWLIPLIITTIMEGVDSYDYNEMLKSNISKYRYTGQLESIRIWQILLFGLALILLILKIGLWHYS